LNLQIGNALMRGHLDQFSQDFFSAHAGSPIRERMREGIRERRPVR
jgi:hypothetical protein